MSGRADNGPTPMPIAIIGIGCRFPGGIVDPDSFWQLLVDGVDAISSIPVDRFDVEPLYDPKPGTRGRITTRFGGFLQQPLEDFDAAFFGISRSYAERLDPQQRLLLETGWEAMEDAGLDIVGMQGSPTGVFVGQWVSDFEHRLFADTGSIDFQMAMGSGRYAAAGRLSYAYGFRGPSLSIDAACSSGLACVHLAVRSLRSGDSAVALAGGVNMILQPHIHLAYSYGKMLAPDGRCRFGDASGGGYVRAEGAGMVVLKPLDAALADGDRVYAVIRGSAVNNDGNSSGAMGRPSRIGQEELIRGAWREGGVQASQIAYVEAHGTGTRAGDPVELSALGAVLAEGRAASDGKTWVGSVKTNFGHTEAAAGVAGLIKASLMLHHGKIPASLHFGTPNPEVAWDTLPIAVPTQLMPWPAGDGARYVGVSSYGIGGTNAHAVLASVPPTQHVPRAPDDSPLLLPLSTRNKTALRALAERYATRLEAPDLNPRDVCWSASTRRSALPHRAVFVAADRETLRASLRAFASGELATAAGVVHDTARRRVAFVVPGQGAQWTGMARQMMAENAAFRDTIHACDAAARLVVPWSLVEQLQLSEHDPAYLGHRIDVIQPTLVALALAYAAWLRSIGVTPDAVVGHSLGEVGAAAIAGVIDLPTAMRIICVRSAVLQRTSGAGAMAVIDLAQADVEAILGAAGSSVTVAVSNSPRSTVISGTPDAVRELLARLDRDGVYARLVNVDVASHGPQMDPLVPDLIAALADVVPGEAELPLYSTVQAARAEGTAFTAEYWGQNLRQPVQFARTVAAMIADGITTFVELGPHAVLSYAVMQTADALGREVVTVACGKRDSDEVQSALTVAATLWASGAAIDWRRVTSAGGDVVALPLYPWQRERFWYDTTAKSSRQGGAHAADSSHPFLGPRIETAAERGGVEWDVRFGLDQAPWLAEHVVRGSAIVPAAAVIDVMVAAVRSILSASGDIELRHLSLTAAIAAGETPEVLRLVAARPSPEILVLQLRRQGASGWQVVASATGSVSATAPNIAIVDTNMSPVDGAVMTAARHYGRMERRALRYGRPFQVVAAVSGTDARTTADLKSAAKEQLVRRVTLLDGALQGLVGMAPPAFALPHETLVPVRVGRLVVSAGDWPAVLQAEIQRTAATDAGVLTGSIVIAADAATPRLSLHDVDMQVIRDASGETLSALQYAITWVPTALKPVSPERLHWLVVCDASGAGTRAAARLRMAGHEVHEWQASDIREGREIPSGTAYVAICTPLDATGVAAVAGSLDDAFANVYDVPLGMLQRSAGAALPPRAVVIVTDGAVAVNASTDVTAPLQAAAWGLARVARHEHPALGCAAIDVTPDALGDALLAVAKNADHAELAWRDGQWWTSRIARSDRSDAASVATVAPGQRYVADESTPGLVESLGWRGADARAPGEHEVEIAVAASGLNFLDVLTALNAYPATEPGSISAAPALGLECSGVVTRVGRAVRGLAVGDRVMAVCEGALASHVVANAALVVRMPDGLSFADASGFPIAFLTAARALEQAARLAAGERVLIHSAAGGVGLAAVQISRARGAEIFATAGTVAKRALLSEMGITHVFDSRTLAWGDEILAATGGRGVDVVLNSLAGEAIETGFRVLATHGRFIEIGKRDVFGGARMGMDVFRKQAMVTSVYLLEQMREDAESLGALFRDLVNRLVRAELTALPTTVWPTDRVGDAFRSLLPGTHVGKAVVEHDQAPAVVRAGVTGVPIRTDATYLVTGGLGTLGMRAAGWLVGRGAQQIVLLGRNAPSAEAARVLAGWEGLGVQVQVVMMDITDPAAIDALAIQLAALPALAGVLHAAGVLDDGVLAAQTPARLRSVAAAKVGGLLQLLRLPSLAAADFVVLYSSVASTFGTRGQANYAAANAVLDAMAQHMRGRGIRATSIGFGPFAGAGLALDGRGLETLADSGIGALRMVHADRALEVYCGASAVHAVVAAFDADAWLAVHSTPAERMRLALLLPSDAAQASFSSDIGLRAKLADTIGVRAQSDLMLAFVRGEIAAVLRTAVERVEPMQALRAMGIDSLTSLELRNRLEHATGLSLPGTLVFSFPNAAAIAGHLLERLTPTPSPGAVNAPTVNAPTVTAATVTAPPAPATVSHDELDALAREMAALDDDAVRRLLATERSGEHR